MSSKHGVSIGIDLGTTNSVAAYFDGNESRVLGKAQNRGLFPSVLSWNPASGILLTGVSALNNWKFAPESTVLCVKRLMGRSYHEEAVQEALRRFHVNVSGGPHGEIQLTVGNSTFTPPQVSAEYLRALKERAENELKRPVESAVITVPAYFEERQRAATREAGELAGLRVKKIIDEPTAAAIAYGFAGMAPKQTILVFDLGGGTFDLSLMHYTLSRTSGDPNFHVFHIHGDSWLGGSDLDQCVADHLFQSFSGKHGIDLRSNLEANAGVLREAELGKIELSDITDEDEVVIRLPAIASRDGAPIDFKEPLNRKLFDKLTVETRRRVFDTLTDAMNAASKKPDDIERVLLVGGATQTPAVRDQLAGIFGSEKLSCDIDPMTVVAKGAAIFASQMAGVECPNEQCPARTTVKTKDLRSGREITNHRAFVNAEGAETCEKCEASLASGTAHTQGLTLTESTASSLGIIAVRGTEHNAYVCLIKRNDRYPLPVPVTRTFVPNTTKSIAEVYLPVYEAEDDYGTGRTQQGVVEIPLEREIPPSYRIEVGFNLDRNRQVTLEITVLNGENERVEGPYRKHLEAKNELPSNRGVENWRDDLQNLISHCRHLLNEYGPHLENAEMERARILKEIEQAELVLSQTSENSESPIEAGAAMGSLNQILFESGPPTFLYLADLRIRMCVDEQAKQSLEAAKSNYLQTLAGTDADAKESARHDLRSAIGNALPESSGTADEIKEEEIDRSRLLRVEE